MPRALLNAGPDLAEGLNPWAPRAAWTIALLVEQMTPEQALRVLALTRQIAGAPTAE
jgi:hypothetical protein